MCLAVIFREISVNSRIFREYLRDLGWDSPSEEGTFRMKPGAGEGSTSQRAGRRAFPAEEAAPTKVLG